LSAGLDGLSLWPTHAEASGPVNTSLGSPIQNAKGMKNLFPTTTPHRPETYLDCFNNAHLAFGNLSRLVPVPLPVTIPVPILKVCHKTDQIVSTIRALPNL
jgi:hypothetical protein